MDCVLGRVSKSLCVHCVCSRQEVCLPQRQHRPRSQGRSYGESSAPGLLRVHVPAAVAVRAAQGVSQPLPAHGRASGMVGRDAVVTHILGQVHSVWLSLAQHVLGAHSQFFMWS